MVLLVITNLRFAFADRVKRSLSEGFIPFIEFSSRVQGSVELLVQRFKGYRNLQQENTDLRMQVSELSTRVAQVSELERENHDFRAMLDFKNRSELKLVSAKVIGRDPSNWWNSVLVDRGTADGIGRDMPVLTVDGLVGKVIEVARNNARILLLVDENCKVSGWMKESGHYGIVRGNFLAGGGKSQCRMTFVNRMAALKPNDKVFTSGLGGIFPRGILIGMVSALDVATAAGSNALFQEVTITPAVDIARIDEVFIGVGVKSTAAPASKPALKP